MSAPRELQFVEVVVRQNLLRAIKTLVRDRDLSDVLAAMPS
jgi:hypothetical protein